MMYIDILTGIMVVVLYTGCILGELMNGYIDE